MTTTDDGRLLDEYRPRVRAALEGVAQEVDAPLDDAVDAVLELIGEYGEQVRPVRGLATRSEAVDAARAVLERMARREAMTDEDEETLLVGCVSVAFGLVEQAEQIAAASSAASRVLPEIAMLLQQLNYPLLHVADDGAVTQVADKLRARFTNDGRPRTNVAATTELATVHEALARYEDVHGDDWPCMHPAVAYVDEAVAALAVPYAAPEQVDTKEPPFRVVCTLGCCDMAAADRDEAARKLRDARDLSSHADALRVEVRVAGGWEPVF